MSIDVTLEGIVILSSLIHLLKAEYPIDVSCELIPNVTLVRLKQLAKVRSKIDVTLSGILILARLVQLINACSPIDVTLEGIVILSRLLHALKAEYPIDVSCELIPNVTFVRLEQ